MAGRIGALGGGIGAAGTAVAPGVQAPQALQGLAPVSPELAQIRYASTWPRGWMAAAVPQRVREFNMQASKAQLALAWLDALAPQLDALQRSVQHHQQLPAPASLARAQHALQQVRRTWQQRHANTLGSMDECLQWSPVWPARKRVQLQGWTADTLPPHSEADHELVAFCLLGQDHAHGAWQAQSQRSAAASQFALAAALAPLGVQLDSVTPQAITVSVDERHWPHVQHNWMVRGQGHRFPAGQWVQPGTVPVPACVRLEAWQLSDDSGCAAVLQALPSVRERVAQVRAQVQQFRDAAGDSVAHAQPDQLQRMQAFAEAFAHAGQAPAYDWVLAVVPAVRTISRLRVARLLRQPRQKL